MKFARRSFLTPVPSASSFADLNTALERHCLARLSEMAGRNPMPIRERLLADVAEFRSLPAGLFERDDRRLLKLQAQLQKVKLLIVDELGYVPLSQVGVELLFEVFSQRYERGSIVVTSNLPFEEWPSIFRSERLTGALLDRLTHHVQILEMNGERYRLKQSARRRRTGGRSKTRPTTPRPTATAAEADNADRSMPD